MNSDPAYLAPRYVLEYQESKNRVGGIYVGEKLRAESMLRFLST